MGGAAAVTKESLGAAPSAAKDLVRKQDIIPVGAVVTVFTIVGSTAYNDPGPEYWGLVMETWGAGGGGGSSVATAAGNSSGGGGGGGGGYARRTLARAGLTFPIQADVGAGGGPGVNGGNSLVTDNAGLGSVLCSASGGGTGGTLAAATTVGQSAQQGVPGVGVIGDFAHYGMPGQRSTRISATAMLFGAGGGRALGGGAASDGPVNLAGPSGQVWGGGGSGAHSANGDGARAGGTGYHGLVVITAIPFGVTPL